MAWNNMNRKVNGMGRLPHLSDITHTIYSPSAEAVFVGKFCTLIKLLSHEVDYLDDEKKLGRHVEQR